MKQPMPARNNISLDDNAPLWYKDAVIYELHIKSFFDSNNDGIGDIRGLIQKLDYIQGMGVTAIWLLPFYPSPLKDDGYDISDYTTINPAYGTLRDFRELLKQAHNRGIRIITELVINHTSDQHPWFQKSRRAKPGSMWRNFYVWSDSSDKYRDARIIFKDFESSNWTWDPVADAYYWHRFYAHQPDLNFENPKVQDAIFRIMDFWLAMGVDGMRLDAVPYLYERDGTNCENLPETHAFLKKLRAYVDKNYSNRMLLAEANQWSEDAVAYFGKGDECHMVFNFPVMPRMFMSVQMEDRFPIIDILEADTAIPEQCQWAIFLRNHDELTLEMVTDEERDYMYKIYATDPRMKVNIGIRRRLAPLLGNNRRKIELMNILLFSLPGTPILYYGDEIGMGDNYHLGDRDGVRTPMQWSPDRNAGFSKITSQKLYLPVIIDPEYHFEAVTNAENQEGNLSSLLWWTKRVISMRRKFKAFSRGDIRFLHPQNEKILAFTRTYQDETILVAVNLSRFSQVVELDLRPFAGYTPEEVFSRNDFPVIRDSSYILTMGPYNHYWFLLKKDVPPVKDSKTTADRITLKSDISELYGGAVQKRFEQEILPHYLKTCRWFGSKGRRIRTAAIKEIISAAKNSLPADICIIEVTYNEGSPEFYLLPLRIAGGEKALLIQQQFPKAVVAQVITASEEGILFDAVYDREFQSAVFDMLIKKKKCRGTRGTLSALPGNKFPAYLKTHKDSLEPRTLDSEQSNSSVIYGNTFILKLFRKLDYSSNPDEEIIQALTDRTSFANIPLFMGTLEYRIPGSAPISTGLLQQYIINEGDAWHYTTGNAEHFFERVLAKKPDTAAMPALDMLKEPDSTSAEYTLMRDLIGDFYLEMIKLLGQRTAELHLALSAITTSAFAPEPFSTLYQRSVFQSMKSLSKQVFNTLRGNLKHVPEELAGEASALLEHQDEITRRFADITGRKITASKIRIHGDYHLGQVLFTGKDFILIDFEGEPLRPLSERKLKRSPLRDVTGMIRSFHYAAYASLLQHPLARPEDMAALNPWVEIWHSYVSNAFLRSYLTATAHAGFIPDNPEDFKILFESFLLEKAVYELGYELNNRPDWIALPLRGIKQILGTHPVI